MAAARAGAKARRRWPYSHSDNVHQGAGRARRGRAATVRWCRAQRACSGGPRDRPASCRTSSRSATRRRAGEHLATWSSPVRTSPASRSGAAGPRSERRTTASSRLTGCGRPVATDESGRRAHRVRRRRSLRSGIDLAQTVRHRTDWLISSRRPRQRRPPPDRSGDPPSGSAARRTPTPRWRR